MIGKLVKKRRKAGNVFYAALTFDNGERKWINLELICKGNQREAKKRLDDLIQICKSLNHSTILSYTKYSEFIELQKEREKQQVIQNLPIKVQKESIIQKIIKFINKLFHKKNT